MQVIYATTQWIFATGLAPTPNATFTPRWASEWALVGTDRNTVQVHYPRTKSQNRNGHKRPTLPPWITCSSPKRNASPQHPSIPASAPHNAGAVPGGRGDLAPWTIYKSREISGNRMRLLYSSASTNVLDRGRCLAWGEVWGAAKGTRPKASHSASPLFFKHCYPTSTACSLFYSAPYILLPD